MKRLGLVLGTLGALALPACGGNDSPGDGPADAATGGGGDDGGGTVDARPAGGNPPDAGSPSPIGEPDDVAGCEDATLYERPADPAARGPWPVGAKTVQIGRLKVEVWYPAEFGSSEGATARRYDIREVLPPSQREKIPDVDNPYQGCDCYPDLPLDTDHGPYPVVLFIHGTASFRTQSLRHMTHWASRGFVVIAAEHPGLSLGDTLAIVCPADPASGNRNLSGDADAMLAALASGAGDVAFLGGHVDMTRVALVGHSAGGGAVASLANRAGVRVVMPWSAGAQVAGSNVESTLFITGQTDNVTAYSGVVSGYTNTGAKPKHLVGIANAGHLVVTELCVLQNDAGKNILEVAEQYEICGASLAGFLFDCNPSFLDATVATNITNYASTAVLENVLQCSAATDLAGIRARFPDVGEYRQDL